ncbi:MAG: MBL fold metallo-hydrolase [Natrialbaceae archaeon]
MVTTISPDRLKDLLDGETEESFVLVDTRPEESYASWHVQGAKHFPFGSTEDLDADGRLEDLRDLAGDADRVVTICATGISSGNLASQVAEASDEDLDVEVQAVDGGMKGWSGVYDRVPVDVGGDVRIVQLQRRAKGCLSYVVGCAETGAAAAVDPTEDVDEVKAAAEEVGLTIEAVIDTHVHADHVSGGRRLADDLDVPYYLSERAEARGLDYAFEPLARNEVLPVGDLGLKALATPGHTSESISLLVEDRALLTADTLHVDSVGRTELEFGEGEARSASETGSGDTASEGEEGARMLYESLHATLLAEPEAVTVLPGHVTVTADGAFAVGRAGEPIATTVGEARTDIDVLQADEGAFLDRLADPGEEPANYEAIIEINRGVEDLAPEERTDLELGPNNCSA